jgi:hypothetical protein
MSAANRRIVSPIDWTFASPKAPWTTSRKAEMVGARSRKAILLSFTNHIFSIQHPDGLRLCHISMADHVETGHEEVGKIGPLCCHVSGMPLPLRYPLTERTEPTQDSNTCINRAWSSQSQQRSEHTGNTKATPKTNCTSGASACRPSGTPPKLQAPSSCNASRCCGRWSAMSVRRSVRRNRRGGWRPRMTLSWMGGWSSNGIMRSEGSWRVDYHVFARAALLEGVY